MKQILQRQITFYLIVLFSIIAIKTSAQVTIGMGEAPISGALLQLKESEDINSNSTRGLGLPRVALRERTQLFPMFDGNTSYVDGNSFKDEQDLLHTGLLVYNISTTAPEGITWDNLKPGLFIWDGKEWMPAGYSDDSGSNTGTALTKPIIVATANNGCAPTFYGGAVLTIENLSEYQGSPDPTFYWTVTSNSTSYTTYGSYQEFCNLVFSSNETLSVIVTVQKNGKYSVSDTYTLTAITDRPSTDYYISATSPAKYCYDINASVGNCDRTGRTQEITTGTAYKYQINGINIASVTWTCSDPNLLVKTFADDGNNSSCTVNFDYADLISADKGIIGNIVGKTFTLRARVVTTSSVNSSCQAIYNISREIRIKDCKCCPDQMTDMSGFTYNVGDFGTAGCWTLQNMRATSYYRGTGIPNGTLTKLSSTTTAETSTPSYAAPNVATDTDGSLFGFLYTARSANLICASGSQGFYLPSGAELQALEQEISANPDKYALYNPYTFDWSGSTYPSSDEYIKYGAGYSMRSWDTSYANNGSSKPAKLGGFDFSTKQGYTLNTVYYSTGAALWVSDNHGTSTPSTGRLFIYQDKSAVPTIYPATYGKASVRCMFK